MILAKVYLLATALLLLLLILLILSQLPSFIQCQYITKHDTGNILWFQLLTYFPHSCSSFIHHAWFYWVYNTVNANTKHTYKHAFFFFMKGVYMLSTNLYVCDTSRYLLSLIGIMPLLKMASSSFLFRRLSPSMFRQHLGSRMTQSCKQWWLCILCPSVYRICNLPDNYNIQSKWINTWRK